MSYIGKTIQQLNIRIKQHNDKNSYCRCLSQAIKEYGWEDNFQVETLWEGDNEILGEMEKKFITEYNTIEPNGYNIREGGGRSEKVSDVSRQLMIEKQREISMRRNGLLGRIIENKSKVDGRITSYRLIACVNGTPKRIGNFKTYEEALKIQKKFTDNPDTYKIPPPKRTANGKSSNVYFDKSRNKWSINIYINGKSKYLGRYETEEKAKDVLERYRKDPENFTTPKPKPKYEIGITFKKSCQKWQASYYNGERNIFLGLYTTKQEAIEQRKKFIENPTQFERPNQRKQIAI